jgi:phospholipase C
MCAIAAATALAAVVGPVAAVGAATSKASPAPGAIDHVIVVMQSGHSFDSYFGTRPKVDGIPAKVCERLAVSATGCQPPYHLSLEQARAGLSDSSSATKRAIDGGKMDGFVTAQSNGSVAMGYLNGGDLPYYWSLASNFTLFDHFFAATQAGVLPNRLVAVAGQTAGINSNSVPATGINIPTIFDRLDQAHLSWKDYVQGYKGVASTPTAGQQTLTPLLAMPSVTGTPARADRIVSTSQYYVDLTKGQLPAVSFVSGSIDSERSPQNPVQGEAFVRSLINTLMQSSAWHHTALLLTYDDSGGWYDHAVPPTVAGTQLGLRVPAILISPYARAGYVDHAQLDTASIPAFIENVFRLPPLTSPYATTGSILSAVNLHQQPIAPTISLAGAVAPVVPRPAVHTIYLLYLAAFIGAGVLVALAFVRSRRDALASPSEPVEPTELAA